MGNCPFSKLCPPSSYVLGKSIEFDTKTFKIKSKLLVDSQVHPVCSGSAVCYSDAETWGAHHWHPQIFSPSGIPVLRKTEMASDFHKFHICVQLEIEKINVLRIETKSLEKSGKQED